MQKRIKQHNSHLGGLRTVTQEPIGSTPYFINNSFRSCLQPKRASVDIKLYLQLHKKILRKAIIEQNFQENLYVFQHSHVYNRKGFIGNARHESLYRKSNISHRQKHISAETTQKSTLTHFKPYQEKLFTEPLHQVSFVKSPTTSLKPNIQHCHSAYRKKFRSKHEPAQLLVLETPIRQLFPRNRAETKVKTAA